MSWVSAAIGLGGGLFNAFGAKKAAQRAAAQYRMDAQNATASIIENLAPATKAWKSGISDMTRLNNYFQSQANTNNPLLAAAYAQNKSAISKSINNQLAEAAFSNRYNKSRAYGAQLAVQNAGREALNENNLNEAQAQQSWRTSTLAQAAQSASSLYNMGTPAITGYTNAIMTGLNGMNNATAQSLAGSQAFSSDISSLLGALDSDKYSFLFGKAAKDKNK